MSVGFSKSGADLKTISPVIGSIVNLLESSPLIDHTTSSSAEYDVTAVVFSGIEIVSRPVIVGATVSFVSLSNIATVDEPSIIAAFVALESKS